VSLIHVLHQRRAEMREAGLGITHGRRRIVFDGAEVALAIDELLAHRPRLRHVDEGGVDHRFAVRMVVTEVSPQIFAHLMCLRPGA
jgi:hypothetical protein